jgi:threonine/homoserine/homoserine lactone efflux protein
MPDLSKLPLFFLASIVLLLTPGPAVLYIIARSLNQGRVAGLVSVLSIELGNMFHVAAATLGLSALLFSSPWAFMAVKYLGAAYLVYLGLHQFLLHKKSPQGTGLKPQSLCRVFSQGVIVAVFNPKTALFFLAFLPQFVNPTQGQVAGQMLALGCIFVLMAIVSDGLYALLAGALRQWLQGSQRFLYAQYYLTAIVYIGLGFVAAFAGA